MVVLSLMLQQIIIFLENSSKVACALYNGQNPTFLCRTTGAQCATGIMTSKEFLLISRQMLHSQLLPKNRITHTAPQEVSPLF